MSPRLIAIAGPLAGTFFPLTRAETSIGSENSNHVSLADRSVSGRHCLIASDKGEFTLRDLDEGNASFVNGLPAGSRALQDGDEIQIGRSLFVFQTVLDEPPAGAGPAAVPGIGSGSVDIRDGDSPASTTVVMHREEVFGDAPFHLVAAADRLSRDLTALIRAGAALNAVRGLAALERPLLELIADAVPATRGALLITAGTGSTIGSGAGWRRDVTAGMAAERPVVVSRSLIDRVLRDQVGVLSYDFAGTVGNGEAAAARATRSLLAAPLVAFDTPLGAIVFEVEAPQGVFDEGHLRLLMAIAGIAATALAHARHVELLEDANRQLQAELNLEHNMVGDSEKLRDIYRRIARVAPTDSTVLITGESGTGKELVARSIHRNSTRSARPFVAINCAAITDTLLESELFGHERGAFTGAIAQKKGRLELGDGGTVFLDEIGELSLALQAKMLRALQEKTFERVGGTKAVNSDFRLIAATNRDLKAAIESGAFRRDLYYRLNVVSLTTPPLRDRRDDIPRLAQTFLRRHLAKTKRPVSGFSAGALACLSAYDWPGNIRELENAIEHAVVLGQDSTIQTDDLPDAIAESIAGVPPPTDVTALPGYHDAMRRAKQDLIAQALQKAGGHPSAAARLLGLHPNYLHRLIRNLQLRADED